MVELVTVIRSLHILFAVLWAGGGLFWSTVLEQFMNRSPEAKRSWMLTGMYGPYLGVTSLLTVVFGVWVYILRGADAYSSAGNAVLGIGMLAGLIGMLVGWLGHLPISFKMAKADAAGDQAAWDRLDTRDVMLTKVSLATVGIALLSMVMFRWF